MKITYYGHSSFLVEARDGTRIILDPYRSGSFGGALRYAPIGESADAVVATHTHDDHGATDTIPGKPLVLVQPTSAKVGGVEISGVAVKHDDTGGSQRGVNTIIVLDDGEIVGCGKHRELLRSCEVYREIALSQLSEAELV